MLVFVDFEHASAYDGEHAQRIMAARTRLTYMLEDLADMPCHLVRYNRIDAELLNRLGAVALCISGNSVNPSVYTKTDLAPIHSLLQKTTLPVFGFCGGFQLLAEAMGASLAPIEPAEGDPTVFTRDDGVAFEFGYHPIDVAKPDHPLFAGLSGQPVFRHAHGFHAPAPPEGFEVLASTATTPVQVAVHDVRKIVGTQFHPEYWTDEHPDGRTLIANFLVWAGIAHAADKN